MVQRRAGGRRLEAPLVPDYASWLGRFGRASAPSAENLQRF
jgi:hypothetical protein